jgi:hypothetical protein
MRSNLIEATWQFTRLLKLSQLTRVDQTEPLPDQPKKIQCATLTIHAALIEQLMLPQLKTYEK